MAGIKIILFTSDTEQYQLYPNIATSPVIVGQGVQGFDTPKTNRFTQERGIDSGQDFFGWNSQARTIWLPIIFKQDNETELLNAHNDFKRKIGLNKKLVLRVVSPDNTYRDIGVMVSRFGQTLATDPLKGTRVWELELIADYPYFLGPEQEISYNVSSSGAQNFFGGASGFATPFYITSQTGGNDFFPENESQNDVYPIVEITGETSGWEITLNGKVTASSYVSNQFDTQIIDYDSQTVESNGTGTNRFLTQQGWGVLRAGEQNAIKINLAGSATAKVKWRDEYYHAF